MDINRVNEPSNICLYCGSIVENGYSWHYCKCKDAIKNREIDDKIIELGGQRPKTKYIHRNGILIKKNING